jgi:ribosomal-protein-alanine N-acetyltransferase
MRDSAAITIRPAKPGDRQLVGALLSTARWRHLHLDWFNALSLLERSPFLLCEQGHAPLACLACPPEPPGIAWLRLLLVSAQYAPDRMWRKLWPEAAAMAASCGATQAVALVQNEWLGPILAQEGFVLRNSVVTLEKSIPSSGASFAERCDIRAMRSDDLPAVAEIDAHAFGPIWRNSQQALEIALSQAALATMAWHDERPAGYQIATTSRHAAHLARLGVEPSLQGKGLGRMLVEDLLSWLARREIPILTVNTQVDNRPALHLYRKLGFREIGVLYPVYEKSLPQD